MFADFPYLARAAVFAVSLVGASARAAPVAHAGDAETRAALERAKAHLERGQAHYDGARYEQALAEFEAAHDAEPLADFHFNMGLCHERLGHIDAAIGAFQAYLDGTPDATDRQSVEHRIAALRAQQPPRELTPAFVVPDAPDVPPPRATADIIDPFRTTGAPADRPRKVKDGRPFVVGGAIATTLGIAIGVAGGVGFGLPAADRDEELDAALAPDAMPTEQRSDAQLRALARERDQLFAGGVTSVSVGAVLVGTGIGLLVVGKRRLRRMGSQSAWLAPTPSGIALGGKF